VEKLIVVVFDNETKALEGMQVLRDLEKEGQISVYESQALAKDRDGVARPFDSADNQSVPLIAGGTAVGALLGLLGGPVCMLVGATAGAVAGSIGDLVDVGVTDEFVRDITTALTPGKAAVVADIVEEWMTPLDTRMENIGGVVFRREREAVKTSQDDRDAAAYRAEMEQLQVERAQARSGRIGKMDARIDHLRTKLENAIERRRTKMRLREQQREAKIEALETEAKHLEGENRRRQEARIALLQRTYEEKAKAAR
jgi:uncharacterized membrane protein